MNYRLVSITMPDFPWVSKFNLKPNTSKIDLHLYKLKSNHKVYKYSMIFR